MKKTIITLICAALLLGICHVQATETPAFVVETVTAQPGETVQLRIQLRNNPGIASAKLEVTYDAHLTLESVAYGDALGGMTMAPTDLQSPVVLNWISAFADMAEDVTYATLTFTVAADAPAGTFPVSIAYNENDVFNILEENIPFAVENGGVTVESAASEAPTAATEPSAATTAPSTTVPSATEPLPGDPENPVHGDGIRWIALIMPPAALGLAVLGHRRKK